MNIFLYLIQKWLQHLPPDDVKLSSPQQYPMGSNSHNKCDHTHAHGHKCTWLHFSSDVSCSFHLGKEFQGSWLVM